MEQVLDARHYESLLAAMPDRRFYHELSHQDAIRPDGSSIRLRMYLYPELLSRLPPRQREIWTPIAPPCVPAARGCPETEVRAALEDRFRKPIDRIAIYPVPILLRDQPGYRIGIHPKG
jgi:hypothetical protein